MYENINAFNYAVVEIEDDGSESIFCLVDCDLKAENLASTFRHQYKKDFDVRYGTQQFDVSWCG